MLLIIWERFLKKLHYHMCVFFKSVKIQKLNVNAKDVSPAGGEMRGNVTRVVSAVKAEGSCQDSVDRLPLPPSVMEMFRDSEEQHIDDHRQHGGRIRSFQHERGNWATYVYLPYEPEDAFLELLNELRVCAAAHGVTLTPAEEFHVSLSRTVVLRHHWIQPFVQSLRSELATCLGFVCLADKLKVYTNPEKTRTFFGMEISTGHMQLLEVVKRVDKLMEEFNLSTYYEDPSFHLSLAWCVGDVAEKLQPECLSELQSLVDGHEDGPFQIKLNCKELHCKTGNKFYRFPLQ
ncbi:U6 snRNA phosphodiesterase 1 isoform 2-T2 [Clarias gariepinus]|uniref:U6 snRNA phosphodiesterase 1 isoform X2 n=1 Tax=Clarias gariepinus TaxID=13013 RepID=UPI00234C7A10|nr:U6 snRNA phosphodiesterase 1 isoform X2 [Clarias gariepinus]